MNSLLVECFEAAGFQVDGISVRQQIGTTNSLIAFVFTDAVVIAFVPLVTVTIALETLFCFSSETVPVMVPFTSLSRKLASKESDGERREQIG